MALLRAAGPRADRRLLAAMLAGLLLSVSCAAPGGQPDPEPPAPTEETSPSTRPTRPDLSRSQPSRPPTTSDTVTLSFGGDVMFEGDLERLLETPETSLAPIRAATGEADFTMVNLESALTTRGTPDPKSLEAADNRYHFRTSASALSALEAAGVDAVSVANNHGADFGARGLADTLRAKVERCAAGHRRRPESRRRVHPSSGDPQGTALRLLRRRRLVPGEHGPAVGGGSDDAGAGRRARSGAHRAGERRQAGGGRGCRPRGLPPLGQGEHRRRHRRAAVAGGRSLPRRSRRRGGHPHAPAAGRGVARSDLRGVRPGQLHLVPRDLGRRHRSAGPLGA